MLASAGQAESKVSRKEVKMGELLLARKRAVVTAPLESLPRQRFQHGGWGA
jgi:hypothetical protein